MPKTPRGKRVPDVAGESFHVVNKAPNGQAEPFFDRTREVWVAPWRKPDGKVGRPTSLATHRKHVVVIDEKLGAVSVRELRPEQVGGCDEIGHEIDVDRRATGHLTGERPEFALGCVGPQQADTIIGHV